MNADKLPSRAGAAPSPADREAPGARRRTSEEGGEAACVDAVIVSADMGSLTLSCVAELEDPALARVLVVDNAFERDGRDGDALGARASIVALPRRLGFAAANNRGIAAGSAPYVLLLNSDVLATAGAVESLLRELRRDAGAVAAGGRLVDPDTLETQAEYRPRPFPTLANFLVIVLGIEEVWPGNPVTRRYHGASVDEHSVRAVAQPAAAALMVKRSALEAVGGFDERFWFWFEDSDLLLRLNRIGRVLYVPGAVFRHLGGGSFRHWDKSERIRSVHHGILHYADAHLSRAGRAVLGAVVLAVSAPRLLLFARSRPQEASAWRAVAAGAAALLLGRPVPAIAPGD